MLSRSTVTLLSQSRLERPTQHLHSAVGGREGGDKIGGGGGGGGLGGPGGPGG